MNENANNFWNDISPRSSTRSTRTEYTETERRRRVQMCLDRCQSHHFPFQKQLLLEKLRLRQRDLPLTALVGTSLGKSLRKLSLSGNDLSGIPDAMVNSFPRLTTLDLSQCDLTELPTEWDLPKLRRLNLSHNRIQNFPHEVG